jgi:hypothetical protein
MFNEILTGKASLENKPKEDPYRVQSVPDVTVPCDQCRKNFTKKATSPATKCVQCHMDNAAREAALAQNTYASPASSDPGMQVLKIFGYIALVALLIYLKWQIRHG